MTNSADPFKGGKPRCLPLRRDRTDYPERRNRADDRPIDQKPIFRHPRPMPINSLINRAEEIVF
jgi:hypothetical protein